MKRFISIKWKISLALVLVSSLMVAFYISMATKTFESDKISYLFDFFQLRVESQAFQIGEHLNRVLLDTKTILASIPLETRKLSPRGHKNFSDLEYIKSINVYTSLNEKPVFSINKKDFQLPLSTPKIAFGKTPMIEKIPGNKGLYKICVAMKQYYSSGIQEDLNVEIIVNLPFLLSDNVGQGALILSLNKKILETKGSPDYSEELLLSVIESTSFDHSSRSSLIKVGPQEYLVSKASTSLNELQVVYIESKESAFSALALLAKRSIVFALFSFFVVGFLALLVSGQLTRNIEKLTVAAQKIGRNELDTKVDVKGNDEIGVLAETFVTMASDIKRLLEETKDNARMVHELQTAKFVQSHLFPKNLTFSKNKVKLAGQFVTSTECGGDWWYYFTRGDDVFAIVADATGHGTPAALITATSRTAFLLFESSTTSLEEMAAIWNDAVGSCAGQSVLMTALLMQINSKTGTYRAFNAGHESPILLSGPQGEQKASPVVMQNNSSLGSTLGTKASEFVITTGSFSKGDRLLIHTDGLWDIQTPNGRRLSERQFHKTLEKINQESKSHTDCIDGLFSYIKKNQGATPFVDDVAAVVIEFSKDDS